MVVMRAVMIVVCLLGFVVIAVPVRRLCQWSGRPAPAGLSRLFCRLLLMALGIRVVDGVGERGRAMRLCVANHVSWLDVLVLGSREPLCFLAKSEVAAWPVIATLAHLQGTVFVDRRRLRQIPQTNRELAERLRRGRTVLLFPEGTTHDGTRRGRFLTSHLACLRDLFANGQGRASCPVQAMALAYSDPVAAWVGDDALVPHLWAVLQRTPITCTVSSAPPIEVTRGYDRKELGRRLAADVEILLGAAGGSPDGHGHDGGRFERPWGCDAGALSGRCC